MLVCFSYQIYKILLFTSMKGWKESPKANFRYKKTAYQSVKRSVDITTFQVSTKVICSFLYTNIDNTFSTDKICKYE